MDLNFHKTTLRLPVFQQSVELDGLITLSIQMRDMTPEQRQALASRNITALEAARRT